MRRCVGDGKSPKVRRELVGLGQNPQRGRDMCVGEVPYGIRMIR